MTNLAPVQLELSERDFAALKERDPRIVDPIALAEGGLSRLNRWLKADMPEPDFGRIQYDGHDSVLDVIIGVLRRVPTPVAWHAVEWVEWIECGRDLWGQAGAAPPLRMPEDDQPHRIKLNGWRDDEGLRSTIPHELGHSWARTLYSYIWRVPRMSERERDARSLLVAKSAGWTPDRLVSMRVTGESLADQLSTLWGFERHTDVAALTRRFAGELAEAEGLADEIARQLAVEDQIVTATERAADKEHIA